jgi:hypothetical protein
MAVYDAEKAAHGARAIISSGITILDLALRTMFDVSALPPDVSKSNMFPLSHDLISIVVTDVNGTVREFSLLRSETPR